MNTTNISSLPLDDSVLYSFEENDNFFGNKDKVQELIRLIMEDKSIVVHDIKKEYATKEKRIDWTHFYVDAENADSKKILYSINFYPENIKKAIANIGLFAVRKLIDNSDYDHKCVLVFYPDTTPQKHIHPSNEDLDPNRVQMIFVAIPKA